MIVLSRGCAAPAPHDDPPDGVCARMPTLNWRRTCSSEGSVGNAAAQDRSARGNDRAASRNRFDVGSTFAPSFTAKSSWAKARPTASGTPRCANSSLDPSAHCSGEGDASAAATDPSPTGVDAQAGIEAFVKKMDEDNLRTLEEMRVFGEGVLKAAVAEIIEKGCRSKGLAFPRGFKPDAVQGEEGDESPDRPPSY